MPTHVGNVLTMLMPDAADSAAIAIETGAITDQARIVGLCRQQEITAAVHLASPLTQDVTARPAEGIADICLGTAAVFGAAREAGLRRVVWASSVAVFGARSGYPPGPIGDDACHRPPSLYGSCKSLCENLARRAFEVDGLDVVGLRLSVVYGAGRLRGYMSYPSHLLRSAAAGEAVAFRGAASNCIGSMSKRSLTRWRRRSLRTRRAPAALSTRRETAAAGVNSRQC